MLEGITSGSTPDRPDPWAEPVGGHLLFISCR
jgi:hypothetical protein